MASSDTTFTIFLKSVADATGITEINQSLAGLQNTITGLAAGATGIVVLDEAIKGLRAGFDLLKGSIEEAAKSQSEAFPIQTLIGNADQAKEKIAEIRQVWEEMGVIGLDEVMKAAQSLIIIGTGADNLIPRLKSMSEISVATDVNLDGVVAAYERLRISIERGSEPMIRGLGGTSVAIIEMIRALQDELSKIQGRDVGESEALKMFKDHTVSIGLLNKAIQDYTTGAGVLADSIIAKQNTLEGATKRLEIAWQALNIQLGNPIRDALTPLLQQIAKALGDLRPIAREVGERIGDLVKAFGQVAAEEGWKTAIKAAWETLMAEIAIIIRDGIASGFNAVASATGLKAEFQAAAKIHSDAYNAEFSKQIAAGKTQLQADWLAQQASMMAVLKAEFTNDARLTGEAITDTLADAVARGKSKLKAALDVLFSPLTDKFKTAMAAFEGAKAGVESSKSGLQGGDIATDFQGGKDKSATDALTNAKYQLAAAQEQYRISLEQTKVLEDSGAITFDQAQARNRASEEAVIAALEKLKAQLPDVIAQQEKMGNVKGMDQARLELQKTNLELLKHIDLLRQATFIGQLSAPIIKLTNDWANLGKQIGGFVTQQFQNFASTAGNAIGALVTGTGNLKQTVQQLAQSFVSSLATMVIQFALSRTLMAALNRLFGQQDANTATQFAGEAATAWAPAATSASIATYGVAAGTGLAAYLAALATGVAAAVGLAGVGGGAAGGAQEGGFAGEGPEDKPAGIFHFGEFILKKAATSAIGLPLLHALNRGVHSLAQPNYRGSSAAPGSGGIPISSSAAPQVHFAHFDDRSSLAKWLEGRHGQKIIYNSVTRQRIDLGLPPK